MTGWENGAPVPAVGPVRDFDEPAPPPAQDWHGLALRGLDWCSRGTTPTDRDRRREVFADFIAMVEPGRTARRLRLTPGRITQLRSSLEAALRGHP